MKNLESGKCSCTHTPQEIGDGACPKYNPGKQIVYGSSLKEAGITSCKINSRIFPIGSLCFVMRERNGVLICESVGSERVRGMFIPYSQIIEALICSRDLL